MSLDRPVDHNQVQRDGITYWQVPTYSGSLAATYKLVMLGREPKAPGTLLEIVLAMVAENEEQRIGWYIDPRNTLQTFSNAMLVAAIGAALERREEQKRVYREFYGHSSIL